MLVLSPQTKVFLAADSTDMRKSFRGLIALTEAMLNQDPASGHLFVFVNGRRTLLKILHWDGVRGGFGIASWSKGRGSPRIDYMASLLRWHADFGRMHLMSTRRIDLPQTVEACDRLPF